MPPSAYSLSNLIGIPCFISHLLFLIPQTTPFPFQSRQLFSSEILAYLRVSLMYDSFPLCSLPFDLSSCSDRCSLNCASDSVSCTLYLVCTSW